MPRKPEGAPDGYMKKLTIAGIGCNPAQAKSVQAPVPCARIWGFASGLHTEPFKKDDPGGPKWTALVGQFQAVNLQSENKDLFEAPWLFLPTGIQEVIIGQVEALKKEDAGGTVAFALDLVAAPAANPSGYIWRAVNLRPVENLKSPLLLMRKEIEGRIAEAKQIEAAKDEKKEAKRR